MRHYLEIETDHRLSEKLRNAKSISVNFQQSTNIPCYGRIKENSFLINKKNVIFQVEIQYLWEIPSYRELSTGTELELYGERGCLGIGIVNKRWEKSAKRNHWKVEQPKELTEIDYGCELSRNEYEWLIKGLTPLSMDDHWFNFYEDEKLYFVRSTMLNSSVVLQRSYETFSIY